MPGFFGNLGASSAVKRFADLYANFGLLNTMVVTLAMMDDYHLRTFDRRYGIRTSGHIELSATSFEKSKLQHATAYGPVNGWGFRRLLKHLQLQKSCGFVDLGSGLGRACFVAAEYGFSRVTGVELAPELCATARENIASCRLPISQKERIRILEQDALEYCDAAEDGVFFMYRAFSLRFLELVCEKVILRAKQLEKRLTIIYTERLGLPSASVELLSNNASLRNTFTYYSFGQAFYVYETNPESKT